jgi:hypothetical protein
MKSDYYEIRLFLALKKFLLVNITLGSTRTSMDAVIDRRNKFRGIQAPILEILASLSVYMLYVF